MTGERSGCGLERRTCRDGSMGRPACLRRKRRFGWGLGGCRRRDRCRCNRNYPCSTRDRCLGGRVTRCQGRPTSICRDGSAALNPSRRERPCRSIHEGRCIRRHGRICRGGRICKCCQQSLCPGRFWLNNPGAEKVGIFISKDGTGNNQDNQ